LRLTATMPELCNVTHPFKKTIHTFINTSKTTL
jgi:hypothetical protein